MNHVSLHVIQKELNRREIIKWNGQPKPSAFAARSLPLFLFAIPWTAFSIFWIFAAAGFEAPDFNDGFSFFPLFGLPFVLIGIAMLFSPLFAYLKAKKTLYVITNQRAFELYYGKWKKIKSYAADEIINIERQEKADGSGNLYFAAELWNTKNGQRQVKTGFLGIEHVKQVESYIYDLKASIKDNVS